MLTGSSERKAPSRLARRYFRLVTGLCVGLLVLSGALEAAMAYREAREAMTRFQLLQAQSAAREIEHYLEYNEAALRASQELPWGLVGFALAQRHLELQRVLRLSPALVELADLDLQGKALIRVSRIAPDELLPVAMASPPLGYGRPYFDDHGVPMVKLVLPRKGEPAGLTVATMHLGFLADLVSGLRLSDGGVVYVLDSADQLVAHADATQVLRQRPNEHLAPVRAARRLLAASEGQMAGHEGEGLMGDTAVSTAVRLARTDWLVFVEHPWSSAMRSAVSALWRTAVLVGLAALLALGLGAQFAQRMAAPIARLRATSATLASGSGSPTVRRDHDDELAGLAEDIGILADNLRQSQAELEERVERRTAELAEQRSEAERANAAKTRFLASASHDLRQPMHAIGLLVGLLRDRLRDGVREGLRDRTHDHGREPDCYTLADKTFDAVQSMDRLFGSLLDISQLDAGAVTTQPEPFALQAVFERLQAVFGPVAQGQGLSLLVRPTALRLHTDVTLVERVLANLVSNALRYTDAGTVRLIARRHRGGAVIRVLDTGRGIPAVQQGMVFDEFVRLAPSGNAQGLGLGLAIVRRSCALLGMTVRLRSRPGRGSVFSVDVPESLLTELQWPERDPSHAGASDLSGVFVMVVDDDSRNVEAVVALLQHWGCSVASATSVEAALVEGARHLRPPDLMMIDWQLGATGNGGALIDRLRRLHDALIPALVLTADLRLSVDTLPAVHVLHKPVSSAALLAAVQQAVARLPSTA